MLRWGPGFFGLTPLHVQWWRYWRIQRSRIPKSGWGKRTLLTNSWSACSNSKKLWQSIVTNMVVAVGQQVKRLTPRQGLHLFLIATALYFFSGWFGGLKAEPDLPESYQRVAIWRTDTRRTVAMDLEEYLKGVVAAEMPASFQFEALKAQAIAARTYTLRIMQTRKGVPGHPEADLITDPNIDQAWTSESTLRKQLGFLEYYWRWRKISRAVDDTRGLVLTYGGDLVQAFFHSDSGGVTEDSENYWSAKVPYLRSVHDPVPAKSPFTETKAEFTAAQVLDAVRKVQQSTPTVATTAQTSANGGNVIEVLERFTSGRVRLVRVGDKQVSGRTLRDALKLRSNWFDVSQDGDKTIFTVHGNGHGVGMSQYGANAYAEQGARYDSILKHYYTGVQITAKY